ncbi:MAG TPA: hypothetical protein VHB73_00200, partial [Alphaproteobacteria bacterium]|nr:hypothetical protein [Alphaproteobacteria bacterium]
EDLNHNKRIQDVITKNPDLLRPPFMRTQFEFPWKPTVEGEPSTFLLTVTDEEEKRKKIPAVMEVMQKGVELMMRQEGLSLLQKMAGTAALLDTYVSSSIHMRMPNGQIVPGLFRNEVIVLLARNGLVRCHAPDYVPFGTKPPEWIMSMGFLTVITMLLLKSRTSILKIEKNQKQPPLGPQGQVRVMRDGKPEPRPFHVISFDLSREFHKNPGISPGDAERNVAEHLVMGHPKLRASGLWWWSPHWRGGTPEEKQARKGRVALGERTSDVFASRPQELVYPGDIGWVPAP